MVHVVACVRYNGNVGGRRREATHVLLDSFFLKHRRACPVCTVLNACFGLSLRGARRAAAAAYKIASAWRAGVRARACEYTEYSKEFITSSSLFYNRKNSGSQIHADLKYQTPRPKTNNGQCQFASQGGAPIHIFHRESVRVHAHTHAREGGT